MKRLFTAKELQSQISKKKGEIDGLQLEIKQKQNELKLKEKQLKELSDRLGDLTKHSLKLKPTEHSLLRYLERVKGINLKEVEEEMLSDPKMMEAISVLGGNGIYPFQGRFQFVVKNNVIVTVKDPIEFFENKKNN